MSFAMYIPKYRIGSVGHLIPWKFGFSFAKLPIHKPSVLPRFNFKPETWENNCMVELSVQGLLDIHMYHQRIE